MPRSGTRMRYYITSKDINTTDVVIIGGINGTATPLGLLAYSDFGGVLPVWGDQKVRVFPFGLLSR